MIVARNDQYTAMRRAAVGIAMFQCVAGSVYARTLAIPNAENTIDLPVRIGFDLLGSEHGGRGQVFIDSRKKFDVVLCKKRFRTPQFQVDGAQR